MSYLPSSLCHDGGFPTSRGAIDCEGLWVPLPQVARYLIQDLLSSMKHGTSLFSHCQVL